MAIEIENATITQAERKEIAETCVYKQDGIRERIVDVNKAVLVMMKYREKKKLGPIVEIRRIDSGLSKAVANGRTFSFIGDMDNNIKYGIVNEIRNDGSIFWRKMKYQERMVFNLNKQSEAVMWLIFRMHWALEGSPVSGMGREAEYKVHDPVVVQRAVVRSADALLDSLTFIKNSKVLKLVQLVRYYGLTAELQDESTLDGTILRGLLIAEAQRDPIRFNKMKDNKDKQYFASIEAGIGYGVLDHDLELGFVYKNINLGTSKEDVVEAFQQKQQLYHGFINEVNRVDTLTEKLRSENPEKGEDDGEDELLKDDE